MSEPETTQDTELLLRSLTTTACSPKRRIDINPDAKVSWGENGAWVEAWVFVRAGHEAGYPTADLEERVLALARALGLEDAQISVTPTVIDVTVGSLGAQRSYTLRVRPSTVDLDRIARLDDLVRDILEGRPA